MGQMKEQLRETLNRETWVQLKRTDIKSLAAAKVQQFGCLLTRHERLLIRLEIGIGFVLCRVCEARKRALQVLAVWAYFLKLGR